MTNKFVTGAAFAAGGALAFLAIPSAEALTQEAPGWSAHRNNIESAQYTRLLQTNWQFRQTRIRKECGPITDPELHQNCVASFDQDAPFLGSRGRMIARTNTVTPATSPARSTPTGDQNASGYGSSVAPPYGTQSGPYKSNPGEHSGAMIQTPSTMPSHPGPQDNGPLSAGGAK